MGLVLETSTNNEPEKTSTKQAVPRKRGYLVASDMRKPGRFGHDPTTTGTATGKTRCPRAQSVSVRLWPVGADGGSDRCDWRAGQGGGPASTRADRHERRERHRCGMMRRRWGWNWNWSWSWSWRWCDGSGLVRRFGVGAPTAMRAGEPGRHKGGQEAGATDRAFEAR
jgi:hypothetical protein